MLHIKSCDEYNKIGNLHFRSGRRKKAMECYLKALSLNPNFYSAYNNIGMLLNDNGDYSNAMVYLKKAITLKPDNIYHLYNMAHSLESIGDIAQSIQYLEKIIQIQPDFQKAHSTFLSELNYTLDPIENIYQKHVNWGKQVESKIVPITNHHSDKRSDRILRVGYLSPNFNKHSIIFFFEPLLSHHNRQHVFTVCYSNSNLIDAYTKRLKSHAHLWRECHQLDDESLAHLIQSDKIDILVDLAGHTINNRLLLFARKPAPIQVTYLGYVNTTGLSQMDYRIVDHWTDPVDSVNLHTEKLVRLPNTFLCYRPPDSSPPVVKAPLTRNHHVTFGSFNAGKKISDNTILLWSKILHAVPSSRFYIKGKSFNHKPTQALFLKKFQANGINSDRLIFKGFELSNTDHLAQYHHIDIGLDTYPYNGTTTTCEAFWMGVPVITLYGDRHVARVGASLLQSIGLKELIAFSEADYIQKAVSIAQDTAFIIQLRKNLRSMMVHSVLCDAPAFAQTMENAYREMWYRYCGS
jgi:predicted O-linked N-acetylglucosamine transferase (SPINDLY family)